MTKCVRYQLQHYMSKMGLSETPLYLGQLCQLIIQRTLINCVKVSALYRQMDVACGQMSVEHDQDRLAATALD